jgi:hypothetical protein
LQSSGSSFELARERSDCCDFDELPLEARLEALLVPPRDEVPLVALRRLLPFSVPLDLLDPQDSASERLLDL